MSVALAHSPADVVARLLVALGAGSDPEDTDSDTGRPVGAWPVSVAGEADSPDNVITCYDTAARSDGRSMIDGEQWEHHGILIRVRAKDHPTGQAKARAVRKTLDEGVLDYTITIGGSSYLVHSFSGTSIMTLGKEVPSSKRSLFTINCLVTITPLA